MTTLLETDTTILFDDPSAVEAFVKKGWLEKVAEGTNPEEFLCRYTPQGEAYRAVISRFEAN